MSMLVSVLAVVIGLIVLAVALVLIGFLIIVLGSARSEKSRVEGGGVIIVGPIPIVIGTSEKVSKLLIVLAIVLTAMAIALFILSVGSMSTLPR